MQEGSFPRDELFPNRNLLPAEEMADDELVEGIEAEILHAAALVAAAPDISGASVRPFWLETVQSQFPPPE